MNIRRKIDEVLLMHLLEFNILIKVLKNNVFDYRPIARFFLLLKIQFTEDIESSP